MEEHAAPDRPPAPSAWWFWVPLAVIAVLDLVTKHLIFAQPPERWRDIALIHPDVNTGVAWSLFDDWPHVIAIVTIILVPTLLLIYYRWFRRTSWFENLIFGCVMGGALGNGYDRVAAMFQWSTVGGVRDFIAVDLGVWPANPWPTFNVADIGISIGFIGLLLVSFKSKRPTEANTGDNGTATDTDHQAAQGHR